MARPGAARAIVGLLDWRTLERVLGRPSVDALVVDRGREVTGALPRSREDIRRVFAAGHGLVVRRAEMHDDGIAGLASAVAQDLPGEVHVQVFASPAGSRSFGWHYDDEEVFVVQTVGVKNFYFRRNTVVPRGALDREPDFGAIRRETSPPMACTLAAGDWLYLPRGWWHVASAEEDSLHLSIGVVPRA